MANVSNSASGDLGADEWLDYGDYGGGSFFTIDWKKDDEYRIWLHPESKIKVFWRVVWKFIDDAGKLRIMRWNSMEHPETLGRFNFKNDDGSREHSPQVDPFAKLIEWVDVQIVAGRIGYVDEIFKWEPAESDEEVILAGGFTGDFQSKDTKTDAEKKKMIRKAGVRLDEAFKHNCNAQEETVLILVDNKDPEAGPQIATVGRGISRALKECVVGRKRVFGEKDKWKADPFRNPVCFSWTRDETGPFPKYSVVATEDPLTDAIKAAFAMPVPDTRKMFEKSNVAVLEKQMKASWCHSVTPPWDEIFGAAFEAVKGTPAAELPEDFKPSSSDDDDDEPEEKPKTTKAAAPPKTETKPAPKTREEELEKKEEQINAETQAGDDAVLCEVCDGVMPEEVLASNPVICPGCGAKYVEDPADPTNLVLEKKEPPKEEPKPDPKPEVRASRRIVTH